MLGLPLSFELDPPPPARPRRLRIYATAPGIGRVLLTSYDVRRQLAAVRRLCPDLAARGLLGEPGGPKKPRKGTGPASGGLSKRKGQP
jgi:hypothetical protein